MERGPAPDPLQVDECVLGVVADIHANPYALAQVMAHGRSSGVERWLVLGDVVALGPEPGRVLEQLAQLDVVAFVAGNTDRFVLTGFPPNDPSFEKVTDDPQLLPRLAETAGSFAWTKGFLRACGTLEMVRLFQPTARLRFPDGTDALAVHASLLADDGRGIAPDVDADEMAALFPGADASLVFGGHTHKATDLTYSGTRFVNPGSVSNHHASHLTAQYSIVRVRRRRHSIEHYEVDYDKQLVIDSIMESGIPGAGSLVRRYFDTKPSA